MINNPSIFQGEQSFGTTAGAPLATDATNKIISGLTSSVASASGSIAATTADVLMTGMTLTPAAGTYLVLFTSSITTSTAGAIATVTMYVGGVATTDMIGAVAPLDGGLGATASAGAQLSLVGVKTVNGSQAIEARWKTSATVANATVRNLVLVRLA